jgi:ribosome maturation factor RimP
VVESSFTYEWAQAHFFIGLDQNCNVMKTEALGKIESIVEGIAATVGVELVEAKLLGGGAHRVLRLLIDKPSGVTHGDCELVSNLVGEALDQADAIPGGAYTLEVSSPGVDRPLVKPKDYERFVGQKVKIQLKVPIEKRRKFDGKLAGFDGRLVRLQVSPEQELAFALEDIEKANLVYEW